MLVTKFIKKAKTESAGQIKNDIWFQLIKNINHNASYYYNTMSSDIALSHLVGGTLQSITSVLCYIIDGGFFSAWCVVTAILHITYVEGGQPLNWCAKWEIQKYYNDLVVLCGTGISKGNVKMGKLIFVVLI